MITVKSAKQTLTGNFEINGYCLMEDEKPTENIANGSKLWELNSGDKYVFDEENTEWIKLTTAQGDSAKSVKTEVHTGTLDALFDISNLKTYYNTLNNGAIGIMTSENMPGVNMALNVITNPDQNDSIIIMAGVGMQGLALREIYGLIDIDDNWPQNFETGSEFTDFILPHFADELGANVMIVVEGLSGSDPQIGFSGVYINTPASHGPLLYTLRESSQIQNLGSFTLTFYFMNNTQPTVTKETISGPISTIFKDNNYTEEQFHNLVQDIYDGKAFASIPLTIGNTSTVIPAMGIIDNNNPFALQFSATGGVNGVIANVLISYFWGVGGDGMSTVVSTLQMLTPENNWQSINESVFNTLTGQSSYNLAITRISDTQ